MDDLNDGNSVFIDEVKDETLCVCGVRFTRIVIAFRSLCRPYGTRFMGFNYVFFYPYLVPKGTEIICAFSNRLIYPRTVSLTLYIKH